VDFIAFFFSPDIKVIDESSQLVVEWVDKSFLCNTAAARVGNCSLIWHRVRHLADAMYLQDNKALVF
jgi:hypothetical protein